MHGISYFKIFYSGRLTEFIINSDRPLGIIWSVVERSGTWTQGKIRICNVHVPQCFNTAI